MNQLEIDLGLIELTPEEMIYKLPTAPMLKTVPKINQTEEMLTYVCKHDGLALKNAAKRLISPELCEIAVDQNGVALEYVPDNIIRGKGKEWYFALCKKAVTSNGLALKYVPEELKDADIIETAILNFQYDDKSDFEWMTFPVAYAPTPLLTGELLLKAVEHTPLCIKDIPKNRITKKMALMAVKENGLVIEYVPKRLINEEIIYAAVSNNETALQFVPVEHLNQDICDNCFVKNPAVFGYLPVEYVSKEMCLKAIKQGLFSVSNLSEETMVELSGCQNNEIILFDDIPEKLRNNKEVLSAIVKLYKYGSFPLIKWNERVIEDNKKYYGGRDDKRDVEIKPLRKSTVDYLLSKCFMPDEEKQDKNFLSRHVLEDYRFSFTQEAELQLQTDISGLYTIAPNIEGVLIAHDFSGNENASQTIYYISDIHIEHQMSELIKGIEDQPIELQKQAIIDSVDEKVREMVNGANNAGGILLIGGDVADSVTLSRLFYRRLQSHWFGGTIISVLGNHELWDGTSPKDWDNPHYQSRPIEEIISDYKNTIQSNEYVDSILLENELYIRFKGGISKKVTEEEILNAAYNDLKDLLSKCTLIVLGGIGYSGLNPVYNSEMGLYRKAIMSIEEDKERAARFKKIYDKVMDCSMDRRVIVLTHMPVYNWSNESYNPNWIYINGHTHQNSLIINSDGTTVLSDNQIGYKPSKWRLHSFTVDAQWYDPFDDYKDGIYPITSNEYREFNRGRGIQCKGCHYEGKLHMIKRDNMYMFVLETSNSLCLMVGGQRRRLQNRDVQYYYDNLPRYTRSIKMIMSPYQKVLKQLSKEIKSIGGSGIIHGCIVDISFFSHVYVNPFDGKLTPYWALDVVSRKPYTSIQKLLEKKEIELLPNFLTASDKKEIPLIGKKPLNSRSKKGVAAVPEWVYGTKMYRQSRVIRAIQYVWEQNVIRIWNDGVLQIGDTDKPLLIE